MDLELSRSDMGGIVEGKLSRREVGFRGGCVWLIKGVQMQKSRILIIEREGRSGTSL